MSHLASALQTLVARVVTDVIVLVLLEQVRGVGTVTLLQHVL